MVGTTSSGNSPIIQQQGSFADVVKQGFAFGVGSSVAHGIIGSMFGGGGGDFDPIDGSGIDNDGGQGDGNDDENDDGSWDV
jgi:hypothetical protein